MITYEGRFEENKGSRKQKFQDSLPSPFRIESAYLFPPDRETDPDELLNFYRRPGTDGVAQRLGKALREYGIANKDPHLRKTKISASLDQVLRTEIKAK